MAGEVGPHTLLYSMPRIPQNELLEDRPAVWDSRFYPLEVQHKSGVEPANLPANTHFDCVENFRAGKSVKQLCLP